MESKPFAASVRLCDDTAIFELVGDIDSSAADKLAAAYEESEAAAAIVLDFGRVDYINSSGIALIVGVLARARLASQVVSAFGLTSHYRHIFEITRLSDYMTINEVPPAGVAAPASIS